LREIKDRLGIIRLTEDEINKFLRGRLRFAIDDAKFLRAFRDSESDQFKIVVQSMAFPITYEGAVIVDVTDDMIERDGVLRYQPHVEPTVPKKDVEAMIADVNNLLDVEKEKNRALLAGVGEKLKEKKGCGRKKKSRK